MHHPKRKPHSGRGFTCVLQHTRLLCPSLFPWVCTNGVRWVSDAIQASYLLSTPLHPGLSLSQHQDLFQLVGSLHQVTSVLKLQLQHQSFQWIFRVDFLWDWLVWYPCSPQDSQESSSAPQFESISSSVLSCLYGPTLTSVHDYWENHSFDFVSQSDLSTF